MLFFHSISVDAGNKKRRSLASYDSKINLIFRVSTLFQMHAMGIHSALAIKRQRKRRDEQKRTRERRYSIQSTESGDTHSPHGSTRRRKRLYGHSTNADSKVR